jgi:hypothetical protein
MRTIYFSAPSSFNDPFDCALQIARADISDEQIDRAIRWLQSNTPLPRSLGAELAAQGQPGPMWRERIRVGLLNGFEKQRQHHSAKAGVACFSARNDNLLMWGHYADGHRGFCLEFDATVEPFSKARPVVYHKTIPKIDVIDILDDADGGKTDVFGPLYLAKAECWQYEEEFRLVHESADTPYTAPYESLKGIYFGAAMPNAHRDVICHLLHGSPVQFHVMSRDENEFAVRASTITYTPYKPGQ